MGEATRWILRCLICSEIGRDLVQIQEHVMREHRYTLGDLREATKRDAERGYVWAMPDGRDWLSAERVLE